MCISGSLPKWKIHSETNTCGGKNKSGSRCTDVVWSLQVVRLWKRLKTNTEKRHLKDLPLLDWQVCLKSGSTKPLYFFFSNWELHQKRAHKEKLFHCSLWLADRGMQIVYSLLRGITFRSDRVLRRTGFYSDEDFPSCFSISKVEMLFKQRRSERFISSVCLTAPCHMPRLRISKLGMWITVRDEECHHTAPWSRYFELVSCYKYPYF